MKSILRLFLLLLIPVFATAQQDPQFTFNNELNSYVNPSFVINDYKLNVIAQHRQQWLGFDGAPVVTLINASYNIEKARSGIGISLLSDQLGAQYNGAAVINYAFDGRIGEHHLIPGIQMGLLLNTLDGSELDPIDGGDPNIVSEKGRAMTFDLGLSLAYRWKRLAIGFSTKHLTAPTLKYSDSNAVSEYTVARHYYFYSSYEAHLGKHLLLKPITFLKTDAASTQFDAQLWVRWQRSREGV